LKSHTQSILDRLTKHAVRMQLPIGAEGDFDGVVDLLTMKAYKFEGEMGERRDEASPRANLKDDAKKYRASLSRKLSSTTTRS
jgi:elongation factor G